MRYVFPELFYAAGASIVVREQKKIALRWLLNPSVGMPRAQFNVWRFKGAASFNRIDDARALSTDTGSLIVWPEGPCVGVQLVITVPAGSVTLTALSGGGGTGKVVDRKTIVGPITSNLVQLIGSPIASITITGNATVESMSIITVNEFVNNLDSWVLVEQVGLPASLPRFAATAYPLDQQGPVTDLTDPVTAAIRRVARGTPDTGWPATTDRGTATPAFAAPDPVDFVNKELAGLLDAIAELLRLPISPADQAQQEIKIETGAPTSIHGKRAVDWESKTRASLVQPLGTMLMSAGSDPFAALGLGFGTVVDPSHHQFATVAPLAGSGIYMVTVKHKISVKLGEFGITITLNGELAALYMGEQPALPLAPAGLTATNSTPQPHLDPPREADEPWLEVAEVAWAVPLVSTAAVARPCGYAIARGVPAGPLSIRTEERLAGGWTTFVPAVSDDTGQSSSIRFAESGVPEAMPGEPTTFVYSVAAHDWFGRWSDWISADHPRISVAPQMPSMRSVELSIEDSDSPTLNASAVVEFTWDWSHRRPERIHLRTLVHAEGTPVPGVAGSVLSVGGPTTADLVFDFTGATPDAPPPGFTLIAEENGDALRTYRVTVNGLQLNFGSHPLIVVNVRARASNRARPGVLSAWSPDVTTSAASPLPPPPPFVPAEMWWASMPDPHEFARTRLQWSATAPMYAVYVADETALLREFNEPSADLEISAADRLPSLRTLDIGQARRAFLRVADRLTTNSLEIELPRGSKLIHFYGVVPISSTGVEGSLPSAANEYFAVAAPVGKKPEVPTLIARDEGGTIGLSVQVSETRVRAGQIEIYRAPSRHRATAVEYAGPPIGVFDESLGIREGDSIRWQFSDPSTGPPWQSVFYRAVARGITDRSRGQYGLLSLPSLAVEVVPSRLTPPPLEDLRVEDVASELDHRLVSFQIDITLARSPRGTHALSVQTVALNASVTTRLAAADQLPLISPTLPGPTEQPDSIFRFDPVNPRAGRFYAWVPRELTAVIVEIRDPAGRTSRAIWEAP